MSKVELSAPIPFHLGSKAAGYKELAGEVLVQIGIVAVLTSAAVILWFVSLLIV